MTLYEQSVKYLDLGLSVIPLEPNSKIPHGKWKQYQTRRMTPAEAKIVFKEGYNIGIALGGASQNLIVIDVDDYKKETGKDIESPMMVFTARGGRHAYFKSQAEIRNTVNAKMAVDVRGWGGQVAAPGSVTPDGMYRWKVEPTAEMIESLPEAPKELLDEIFRLNEKTSNGTSQKLSVTESLNVTEGGRNDTLHRLALSLVSKHPEDEAWALVVAANNSYSPPLPEDEVRTLFNSAMQRLHVSPPIRRELIGKEQPGFRLRTFSELVDEAKDYIAQGKRVGLRSGYPEFDAITGGFFLGQTYLTFADTSVGKSIWQLNVLMYMAKHGEKVMYFDLENSFESMTAERMVLINEGGNLTKQEWDAFSKEQKMVYIERLRPLPFMVWDQKQLGDRFGNVVWKDCVEKCILEGVEQGYRVFAIDHLHYFETSQTDYAMLASVAKDINDIAARHNVCILMVAHTKKGLVKQKNGRIKVSRPTVDDVMGSGLLSKHTKNVIGLQRNHQSDDLDEHKEMMVYIDKTKFGPTGKIAMEFNPYTLVVTDPGYYKNEEPWAPTQPALLDDSIVTEPETVETMSDEDVFNAFN